MYKPCYIIKLLLALVAGMGTTLAYAPFSISTLAILCPALLLLLWQKTTPKNAALLGLSYGIGLFGTGTWWIFISMREFGHMDAPLAMVATMLVVLYESLFPALQGYVLTRWTAPSGAQRLILFFPTSWVLLEWLRSGLFTGWHWLIAGYSQIDAPLGGYAPIIGTYGVSVLTMLSAGILVHGITSLWNTANTQSNTSLFTQLWRVKLNLIIIAVIWFNGALLTLYPFTEHNGKSLTVSMIQGNVPQELKWQPDQLGTIVDKFHTYTRKHWQSDLIIWPEGAIPALSTVAEPFLDSLDKEAKAHHSSVMLGIIAAEGKNYYNGLIMVGQSNGYYYKRHLVPFGEYAPLKSLTLPLTRVLNIPMSDLSSGPLKQPLLTVQSFPLKRESSSFLSKPPSHNVKQEPVLTVNNIHMAAFICYEIVEPDEVRRSLSHAELIVTITDDSWFDGSIASEQHLQMARMRSVENGLPQLFLSSRGASAIINNQGKILQYLPEHQEGVITATVATVHGNTPWGMLGSWPVLLLSMLGVLVVGMRYRKS